MDDLLKEAIADAKAVRQTAFENAKIALEEAFTPKIQSMLSKKIQKETEGEEYEEEDEVPAEEEDDDGGEKEVDVAVDDSGEEGGDEDVPVEDEEEVPAEEGDDEEAEEGEGEEDVPAEEGDDEEDGLDLEAIIRELEGEEAEEAEEPTDEYSEGDDEEVDETVELNGQTYRLVKEDEETEEGEDEDAVEEQTDSSKIGTGDNKVDVADSSDEEDPQGAAIKTTKMESFDVDSKIFEEEDEDAVEEDIDLEEVLKSLSEEEETEENDDEETKQENVQLKADLGEHRKVIKYLKSKLNEINLLNAKLLFTNKLFKAYNLNNDEKMKVVETFDRAGNIREIKLVFSTLAESFGYNVTRKTAVPVKNISEGASKAGGSTKPSKQVISEGDALSNRFKKLAGII